METITDALQVVTSRRARRTALRTGLLGVGSVGLFFLSVFASVVYYNNYMPDLSVGRAVYLQYGSGPNPFATVSLSGPGQLKAQVEYDVSVTLSVPLSPANTERGNFMIRLYVLARAGSGSARPAPDGLGGQPAVEDWDPDAVLFRSRRPALIPYRDRLVSLTSRILLIGYHLLAGPASQTHRLTVPLAERVRFAAVPETAYIEIEAGQAIQTYDARLTFTARLGGLRWIMHSYRTGALVVMVWVFWVAEMVFACVAWVGLSKVSWGGKTETAKSGKRARGRAGGGCKGDGDGDGDAAGAGRGQDSGSGSDSARTFPTYGHQPALRYEPKIKKEVKKEEGYDSDGAVKSDDGGAGKSGRGFVDSGLGSSMAGSRSGGGGHDSHDSLRRRLSRPSAD